MGSDYPVLAANNVGRICSVGMIPGPISKTGTLLTEGFFASPQVRWEQRIDNGYPNVFYDDIAGEFRCYYTCHIEDAASIVNKPEDRVSKCYDFSFRSLYPPRVAGILLATSKDGLAWTRPNLGLVEYEGSKENNILFDHIHGASVFLDKHETDRAKRYKMVVRHDAHEAMAVSFSADGIHWQPLIDWPDYNPAGDTHNFAFWDETIGRYVLITRTWDWDSLRLVSRCESDDFIHWTRPVEVYRGIGLDDQIYSMPVFRHGELYVGLASIFHGGDRSLPDFDCVDCELTVSGDGIHWDRPTFRKPFIPRGQGVYGSGVPDACCIYASAPVIDGNDYLFYYFGSNGQHTNFRESHLMMARIPMNKLCGLQTIGDAGWMESKPMRITGDELFAVADIGEGGYIRAEIGLPGRSFYEDLRVLDGYGTDDCTALRGGDGLWRFTFKGGPLSALCGREEALCVKFAMKNATLYQYGGDVELRRRKIDQKV